MDALQHILNGFAVAAQPLNILFVFIGVLVGSVVGMLPGIGPAAGIALLLPLTFGLDPIPALIMLAGIYYGAMYGNSAAAILINTPGTASAAMTSLDGYPMAKKGRGGAALAISAVASFIAGTVGIVVLSAVAVPLTAFALRFGPAEYFMLMVFALTAVGSLTGRSLAMGMIAVFLGLMIGTVGTDLQSGVTRFTFGVPELLGGVPFVVVIVGLFAVGEVLVNVERWFRGQLEVIQIKGRLWASREEWGQCWGAMLRGGVIGFLVGILPGAGGSVATVLSYGTEKRLSRTPERFGHGAPEGVAGPEAANNASTCGAMVPLLTLGIPGSGTAAVLLAAFIMFGVQPGPLLFASRPDLVWGLINSMYIGNVMLLILNLPLIGFFVRVLYMPPGLLMSLILAIASIGVYSINYSVFDLYVMLLFGGLSYVMRRIDMPIAPLILALILGGMMEQAFRQAMTISRANPMIFVSSPISLVLLAMIVLSLAAPIVSSLVAARRAARVGQA